MDAAWGGTVWTRYGAISEAWSDTMQHIALQALLDRAESIAAVSHFPAESMIDSSRTCNFRSRAE